MSSDPTRPACFIFFLTFPSNFTPSTQGHKFFFTSLIEQSYQVLCCPKPLLGPLPSAQAALMSPTVQSPECKPQSECEWKHTKVLLPHSVSAPTCLSLCLLSAIFFKMFLLQSMCPRSKAIRLSGALVKVKTNKKWSVTTLRIHKTGRSGCFEILRAMSRIALFNSNLVYSLFLSVPLTSNLTSQ